MINSDWMFTNNINILSSTGLESSPLFVQSSQSLLSWSLYLNKKPLSSSLTGAVGNKII